MGFLNSIFGGSQRPSSERIERVLPPVMAQSLENPSTPLSEIGNWGEFLGLPGTNDDWMPPVSERTAMACSAVYRCVTLEAGVIAGLPLKIYRLSADGQREELPNHRLMPLLQTAPFPGRALTAFSWRELWGVNMLLWGNHYSAIRYDGAGRVIGFNAYMPWQVQVVRLPGKRGINFADDGTQAEWGVGVLTVGTPNTLSRQTVTGTTQNTAQALNFTGTVRVYSWMPAAYTPVLDGTGSLALRGDLSAQSGTLSRLQVVVEALVPSVTNWGSQQALPAVDAQSRFINKDVGGGNFPVLNIQLVNAPTEDNGAAYFQFLTTWGALAVPTNANVSSQIRSYAQPIGNYAQSQALTDTAAYLQSQINDKQPTGTYVTTQTATSGSSGDLKINAINFSNSANAPYLSGYKPDGSLTSYILAQIGDLPLDRSKKLHCWQVVIQNGQRVNFPSGFSGSPDSINFNTTQRLDLWWTNANSGGFTINSNSNASQQISVIASGPR